MVRRLDRFWQEAEVVLLWWSVSELLKLRKHQGEWIRYGFAEPPGRRDILFASAATVCLGRGEREIAFTEDSFAARDARQCYNPILQ